MHSRAIFCSPCLHGEPILGALASWRFVFLFSRWSIRMNNERTARIAWLKQEAKKRILLLDGAWGVMIQDYRLSEADFRGERFRDYGQDLKGNNDLLTLTRPDIIRQIGRDYLAAGADILETNTFNSTSISQADYGLSHLVGELNEAGAALARAVCDEMATPERPRLVAGVLGPTNR